MSEEEKILYRLKPGMRHYIRDTDGELLLLANCEALALTATQFQNYGDKFEPVVQPVAAAPAPASAPATKRTVDFESMSGKDLIAFIRKLDSAELLAGVVAYEKTHEKRKGVLKAAGIRARKLAR